MRLSRQIQKHIASKNKRKNKIKRTKKQQRQLFLARTKTSKRVKIVCLHLGAFFMLKIFL